MICYSLWNDEISKRRIGCPKSDTNKYVGCSKLNDSYLNWKAWRGEEEEKKSRLSETEELGLGVGSRPGPMPLRRASTFFLTRPRRFSNLDVSMEVARLRADFPGFAPGLIIHHEDFPVPSFCTRMNRSCSDRLCRIEF